MSLQNFVVRAHMGNGQDELVEQVEFANVLSRAEFETMCRSLKTVSLTFEDTDHLHHKYIVQSAYPSDFVRIGEWIGSNCGHKIPIVQADEPSGSNEFGLNGFKKRHGW